MTNGTDHLITRQETCPGRWAADLSVCTASSLVMFSKLVPFTSRIMSPGSMRESCATAPLYPHSNVQIRTLSVWEGRSKDSTLKPQYRSWHALGPKHGFHYRKVHCWPKRDNQLHSRSCRYIDSNTAGSAAHRSSLSINLCSLPSPWQTKRAHICLLICYTLPFWQLSVAFLDL